MGAWSCLDVHGGLEAVGAGGIEAVGLRWESCEGGELWGP